MNPPPPHPGEATIVFTRINPNAEPKPAPPEGSLPCPGLPNTFAVWHGPDDGLLKVANELLEHPDFGSIETCTPWPLEKCGTDGEHVTLFRRVKP